jgi:hypothetical protein
VGLRRLMGEKLAIRLTSHYRRMRQDADQP